MIRTFSATNEPSRITNSSNKRIDEQRVAESTIQLEVFSQNFASTIHENFHFIRHLP